MIDFSKNKTYNIINIIIQGSLVAHGTSYFLKNKFGRGYYMTLAKKTLSPPTNQDSDQTNPEPNTSFSSDSGVASSHSSNLNKSNENLNEPKDFVENNLSQERGGENRVVTTTTAEEDSLNGENNLKRNFTFNDKKIHDFVKNKISNAILVENVGTEMTYSISNKIEHTKNYESFFHEIEKNMSDLGEFS